LMEGGTTSLFPKEIEGFLIDNIGVVFKALQALQIGRGPLIAQGWKCSVCGHVAVGLFPPTRVQMQRSSLRLQGRAQISFPRRDRRRHQGVLEGELRALRRVVVAGSGSTVRSATPFFRSRAIREDPRSG